MNSIDNPGVDDRKLNDNGVARAEIGNVVRYKRSVSW
jgi:hypothetical protein